MSFRDLEAGNDSYLGKRSRWTKEQRRAYFANKKFNKAYPWSTHGAARIQRGTKSNIDRYGETWKLADELQRAERIADAYTGRGKYGKLMKGLVKAGKKAKVGKLASSAIQSYAGRGLYGRGMYTNNVTIAGGRPPMDVTNAAQDNQEMVLSHTEYLQDVFCPSSSNFENQAISINPGIAENFPWLSQFGCNYEEYEFIQLIFNYRSTIDPSAANNSTGATGTLIMATNYNPDAPEFVTKEAMMQYHGAISGRLTDDLTHGVECDPTKNAGAAIRFTRTFTLDDVNSLKDFDLGKFQFAIVNAPSAFFNQQLGELWVTYKVKLGKPRLFSGLYRNLPLDSWVWNCYNAPNATAYPLGAMPGYLFQKLELANADVAVNSQNSLGIRPVFTWISDTQVNCTITCPDFLTGTFLFTLSVTGTSTGGQGWQANFGIASATFSGNCRPIGIMGPLEATQNTSVGPAQSWYSEADTTVGATYGNYCLTGTFGCTPATAGIDNQISFQLQCTSTDLGALPYAARLNIMPFNSTLSDQFVYSNGTKITYNKDTGVQLTPWQPNKGAQSGP